MSWFKIAVRSSVIYTHYTSNYHYFAIDIDEISNKLDILLAIYRLDISKALTNIGFLYLHIVSDSNNLIFNISTYRTF